MELIIIAYFFVLLITIGENAKIDHSGTKIVDFFLFLIEIRQILAKFPSFSAQISDKILSSSENSLKTGVGHILNLICF